MPQVKNVNFLSYIYTFIGVFLFSTTELAGKFAGAEISPTVITIIRFFIGSALLLPIAAFKDDNQFRKISVRELLLICYPGLLNVAGAMLFLQFAIFYGKASTSAMLISSNPVFVAIFAFLILKERLCIRKIAGILLGLAGLILIILGDDPLTGNPLNPLLGLLFGVLASLFFGLYTVLAKKRIAVYGNFFFNTVSFAGGALALLIIFLFSPLDCTFVINSSNILLLLYMGIFITGIAYIFFFAGLKNIPTTNGAIMFFFKPAIAVMLAYLILGETVTIIQIIGVILIVMGVYITNMKPGTNFIKRP